MDFWPAEVDDHYRPAVDVAGDIADALWQMNEEINNRAKKRNIALPLFDINSRALLRKTIKSDLEKEKRSKAFPMKPQKVLPVSYTNLTLPTICSV